MTGSRLPFARRDAVLLGEITVDNAVPMSRLKHTACRNQPLTDRTNEPDRILVDLSRFSCGTQSTAGRFDTFVNVQFPVSNVEGNPIHVRDVLGVDDDDFASCWWSGTIVEQPTAQPDADLVEQPQHLSLC